MICFHHYLCLRFDLPLVEARKLQSQLVEIPPCNIAVSGGGEKVVEFFRVIFRPALLAVIRIEKLLETTEAFETSSTTVHLTRQLFPVDTFFNHWYSPLKKSKINHFKKKSAIGAGTKVG